jgi:hypothetical protein
MCFFNAEVGNAAALSDDVGQDVVLEVHLHVLESRFRQFHALSSDEELARLMGRVNEIWAPAGIRWQFAVSRERLIDEERLVEVARGTRKLSMELLGDLLPGNRADDGWHAYLANDMTRVLGAPGAYLSHLPAALVSEVDPAGLKDPGRILAHELGHSLALEHKRCRQPGNLMAPACDSVNRVKLLRRQIKQARAQALTGAPVAD